MKPAVRLVVLYFTIACVAVAADKNSKPPEWVPIQIPGASTTIVNAINNSGVMAGQYDTPDMHCFVIVGRQSFTLDVPKSWGHQTVCSGINSEGTLVGSYQARNTQGRAFIYQNGKFTDISPNSSGGSAYGVNDLGQVVGGYSEDGDHADGFLWDGVSYQRLDVPGATDTTATAINNQGIIILQFFNPGSGAIHSCLYDGFSYTSIDIPGAGSTAADGINNAGDVIATWSGSDSTVHGAILHAGEWHKFMVPGSNDTFAYGINDQDVSVGYSWNQPNRVEAGFKMIP